MKPPGALERFISAISPKWGAQRAAWRVAEEMAYRAATRARTDRPATHARGSADHQLEAGYDREKLILRSRELERDNVLAEALLSRSVENIIGSKFGPQARTADEGWNARAEALFWEWAEHCDIRGLDTFHELLELTCRSYLRDGDVGTHLLDNGPLQTIAADQIADPPGKIGDKRFIDGIEVDVAGRPIAYHVVDESKTIGGPKMVSDRRSLVGRFRIPAESFLFLARRKRLNQTRGEPAFAQGAWLFEQLEGNIEAVTIAARMAACFGLVIERGVGYGGLPTTTGSDAKSYRDWRLEPGMVREVEPGDKVTQVQATHPTQNFTEFVTLLGRLVGIAFGLPIELVLLDWSRTNFSSMRGAMLQAYRSWRCHQGRLINNWCRPLWRWKIDGWIADGKLPDREDKHTHIWQPPGWQWVDPKAEVDSNLAAIDAGFRTLHDVLAEQGRDFDEQIAVRSAELKAMEAKGIPIIRSMSTRDPLPPGQEPGAPKKKPAAEESQDVARIDRLEGLVEGLSRARAEAPAPAPAGPAIVQHVHEMHQHLPESTKTAVAVALEAKQPDIHVGQVVVEMKEGAVQNTFSPNVLPSEVNPVFKVPEVPPAPVNITAVPGETRIEAHVTADVKLPERRKTEAVIEDKPGGKTKITIGPG